MKMSKEEFKNYLVAEVKKIALSEGINASNSDILEILKNLKKKLTTVKLSEGTIDVKSISKENLNESFTVIPPDSATPTTEDAIEGAKEVKQLNEEFKRWKHLVDFRSPLLNKD